MRPLISFEKVSLKRQEQIKTTSHKECWSHIDDLYWFPETQISQRANLNSLIGYGLQTEKSTAGCFWLNIFTKPWIRERSPTSEKFWGDGTSSADTPDLNHS